jgi:predicted negative regulator of RcsB-dependent stress response
MAKPLDLDEQEQLDQIKHFWAKYGNAISAVLIVVFGSFAAWNGWHYWQNSQASQAAVLFDEVERAANANQVDRMQRALSDMQASYGGTVLAAQASLLAAKVHTEQNQTEPARAALNWVVKSADGDEALQAIARLRLSALDMQAQAWDAALAQLAAPVPIAFAGLVADRRGDVFSAQGKTDEARQAYESAYRALAPTDAYRTLVAAKLATLGVDAERLVAP